MVVVLHPDDNYYKEAPAQLSIMEQKTENKTLGSELRRFVTIIESHPEKLKEGVNHAMGIIKRHAQQAFSLNKFSDQEVAIEVYSSISEISDELVFA